MLLSISPFLQRRSASNLGSESLNSCEVLYSMVPTSKILLKNFAKMVESAIATAIARALEFPKAIAMLLRGWGLFPNVRSQVPNQVLLVTH